MRGDGGPKPEAEAEHESIKVLLDTFLDEKNPKRLIRRLAQEKVAYAKSFGWAGPPFCPKQFASLFGIRCQPASHDIGGDGRILHIRGKLVIEYKAGQMPERQRFTIFHEFAHTLFPDFGEFLPQQHSSRDQLSDAERRFEFLCDLAAAEMLLPVQEFESDLNMLKWHGFESVHELRKRYHASIDATTYRLVELMKSVGCCVAFLTDQRGTFTSRGPLWVKNSSPGTTFKSFIKAGTMPPPTSVAYHCYSRDVETSLPAKETWWINGKPRTWLVQATKLPTITEDPTYPRVAVLIFPSSYGKEHLSTLLVR